MLTGMAEDDWALTLKAFDAVQSCRQRSVIRWSRPWLPNRPTWAAAV